MVSELLSVLVGLLVLVLSLLLLLFGDGSLNLRGSEHLSLMDMLYYLRGVLSHDLALKELLVLGRRAEV